jgi:hypothetical protein
MLVTIYEEEEEEEQPLIRMVKEAQFLAKEVEKISTGFRC